MNPTAPTLRIKICGITNLEDALAATEAGADALGFMFYRPSKRFVTPDAVTRIVEALPPAVSTVGVFVNEDAETICELKQRCQLDTIQLHGDESPSFAEQIPGRVIKAFRVDSADAPAAAQAYRTSAWLFDSYSAKGRGGTGEQFNWDWVRATHPYSRPVFIAGGLTPENVGDCVRATLPYGLDVSSGVEDSPGKKSALKMTQLMASARLAASEAVSGER